MISKPQSLWLNRDNAGRYVPYLSSALRHAINSDGAYMMSVFVNARPLGVLYADGDALDSEGYKQFRLLCQEAVKALGTARQ